MCARFGVDCRDKSVAHREECRLMVREVVGSGGGCAICCREVVGVSLSFGMGDFGYCGRFNQLDEMIC